MARRRGVRLTHRREDRVSLEWLGFHDGGTPANLDTQTAFELVPPGPASGAVESDLTVLRVVGNVSTMLQNTQTVPATVGMQLHVGNVGGDQAVDDAPNPLSTDIDDADHAGIMWWMVYGQPTNSVASADRDLVAVQYPIDIKVKRKLSKRDTLVFRVESSTTGIMRVFVNLRTLIRLY